VPEAKGRTIPPLAKLGLDLGPLVIFFVANWLGGIFVATGVFMVAMLISIGIGFAIERKISPMPLITAALVLFFGGLTLWLADQTFIKIKPTILYTIFAIVLVGGLAMGRIFIKTLLSGTFNLPDHAWRTLTWRWAIFFVVIAVANEVVWRNATDDQWVAFKVWGLFPLTLIFAFAQTPFLLRHQIEDKPQPDSTT
jgi:intracellular septation protein